MKTLKVSAPLISGLKTQNMTEFVATVMMRLYLSVEKSTKGTITVIIIYWIPSSPFSCPLKMTVCVRWIN